MLHRVVFVALVLGLLSLNGVVRADDPDCQYIDKLPFTASSKGLYCLKHDLVVPPGSYGITIAADRVDIDMYDYEIRCSAGPDADSRGIYGVGISDARIRGGTIRKCLYGISIEDTHENLHTDDTAQSSDVRISSVILENNYFRGIRLDAAHSSIRDIKVSGTGGTKLFPDSFAIGIEIYGPQNWLSDIVVENTYAVGKGESVGISFSDLARRSRIRDTLIKNDIFSPNGFGIWIGSNSYLVAENVEIWNYKNGIAISGEEKRASFKGIKTLNVDAPYLLRGIPEQDDGYVGRGNPHFQE